MKIAILGSRGIPCRMGGFERYAEEIGARLVALGNDVTVYCEYGNSASRPASYRGMRLVHLPHLKGKIVEALSFDLLSSLHSSFCDYDIVYMLGFGWGYFCLLPKIFGKTIVINMDGMEWERDKWGRFGKLALVTARNASLRVAQHIVCDSIVMKEYYEKNFDGSFHYLTYGADIRTSGSFEHLKKIGLEARRYITVVCRFEPENNLRLIIDEFLESSCSLPLVVVGGSTYSHNPLMRYMQGIHDKRVLPLGVVADQELLAELRVNALAHIHGHEVGGTNPSLLDAMGCGNIVLALDVPYNREVLEKTGIYFTKERTDLARQIDRLMENPASFKRLGELAQARIKSHYDWDSGASLHNKFFNDIAFRPA